MIVPTTLLQNYLRALRELTGAGCVSLYVPISAGEKAEPALLHDGHLSPVPELEGEPATLRLVRRSEELHAKAWPSVPTGVDSADPDCLLMALPSPEDASNGSPGVEFAERRRPTNGEGDIRPAAWLGLRFAQGERPAEWSFVDAQSIHADTILDSEAGENNRPGWSLLLGHAGLLAAHVSQISSIHNDRTTGLPDRPEFQSLLKVAIDRARLGGHRVALLWVNPDDFVHVNERFGSESGDRAVREIADRLRHLLRTDDLVARYGGATLAVLLRGTSIDRARSIAGRIQQHLSEASYLEGKIRLDFSIGLAMFEPDDQGIEDPLELVRRADQALSTAKRMGGGTIASWDEDSGAEQVESFDRMAGIFTGDVAKDYRNMKVLWDTINVVARHDSLDHLATQAVGKLFEALKPDSIGLFAPNSAGQLVLLQGLTRQQDDHGSRDSLESLAVDSDRLALMRRAMEEGSTREALLPEPGQDSDRSTPSASCYAVPLSAGKEPLGTLYIEWKSDSQKLDSTDLVFLNGLGLQITMAWDRARLVELELSHQESEKRQLRAELGQLRQAVRQAKLVYRSPEMEAIMGTARRVARSDATILITGPSGTGKELVARTVHELSDRRDKPFVIVDCSSIPTTLIESELFGSERGAFTGAQQRRRGRLAEADRGTVLLDEIGELPLEVQSKFLRFVQEKQFTSVGGSGSRTVDVRILAATNRDLLAEAAAGRFREDLYYRLNVIQLAVPPLKDRGGDIILLAQHFLELFCVQYQRDIRGLSPEAGQRLLEYSWPGNVRELQNRIMQAVLLCEDAILKPEDLGLSTAGVEDATAAASSGEISAWEAEGVEPAVTGAAEPERAPAVAAPAEEAAARSPERLLEQLGRDLGLLVAAAISGNPTHPAPIGRWMNDELLLAANRAADGIGDRGAIILGMAPTTYRRRLEKAHSRRDAEAQPRPPEWDPVRDLSRHLVELAASGDGPANLPVRCERALLTEIVARYPGQARIGSALLGVTPPTFKSRAAALR